MAKTYGQAYSSSWSALGMRMPLKGPRMRFEQTDFEALKADYVAKYGYSITIPGWDDIIKWKPDLLKTNAEKKQEKLNNLQRMLASPAPEFARKYGTVMTWIDNIQDTASIVYPAFRMLVRAAPKIFARAIPGMGWLLLGYDLLNLANAIGRAPFSPMRAKRAACEVIRNNPFTKQAQYKRVERIKNWNPGWTDILQVLQVTQQFTGVGLSLGAAVGFVQDLFYGAYRQATGAPVAFKTEFPPLNFHEFKSAAGMKAAAFINSGGQTFSEEMHFLSQATFAASTFFMTPVIEQFDIAGCVEDPMSAIIDAPEPTDPLTIEVIESQGLRVQDGIGWPANESKKISLQDLSDYTSEKSRATTTDYYFRNSKNSYGFVAAGLMGGAVEDLIDAMEPGADYVADDTPMIHTLLNMLKDPLLPGEGISPGKWLEFETWVNGWADQYGSVPKISDVRLKFDSLGIPYRESFPATMDPAVKDLFPDPFDDSEYA